MVEKVYDRRVFFPGHKVFSEGDKGLAMYYVLLERKTCNEGCIYSGRAA